MLKKAFYPEPEVARALGKAPAKKVSEWVNRLILKGLEMERREKLARDYEDYDRELASREKSAPKKPGAKAKAAARPQGAGAVELQTLFTDEDETDRWF